MSFHFWMLPWRVKGVLGPQLAGTQEAQGEPFPTPVVPSSPPALSAGLGRCTEYTGAPESTHIMFVPSPMGRQARALGQGQALPWRPRLCVCPSHTQAGIAHTGSARHSWLQRMLWDAVGGDVCSATEPPGRLPWKPRRMPVRLHWWPPPAQMQKSQGLGCMAFHPAAF